MPTSSVTKTWLIGSLFTLTLLFGGWAFTNTGERLTRAETMAFENGQHIASMEARYAAIEKRLERIESLLQWIATELYKRDRK